ncbi:glutaminase [Psychromonas sp. 14N.309.X.WAT.B.A12]|uniref:glutaminase n=1 Tax=unclassified Psychromonas TaxID=2614957 RepID=UPI0025B1ABE5|nr:glutaminase [Psychromonas sp. 14N.309.X.WAT.B.A12]MDN2662681.1 glutaminase [Psychromonas sp. 14N.309.X.WAT.B.A12]
MKDINFKTVFNDIFIELQPLENKGVAASYIPELAKIDPDKLGIHLVHADKGNFYQGDSQERFSIQSISKVFSLTLAMRIIGGELWSRVGVEPSGTAFNSLIQLEVENGIPRNPFINAGAIVICDVLMSYLDNPKVDLLNFIRKIANNPSLQYNETVAESEKLTSDRNKALIYLMRDFGNIHNDVDEVLDLYFYLCSIEMNCCELAHSFMFLVTRGVDLSTGEVIVTPSQARRINAVMQSCGFYDEAGEFAFKVGLPGKSGVGGGIVALHPGKYAVAVWSPRLNKKGNSYMGMKVLELLTTKMEDSIF